MEGMPSGSRMPLKSDRPSSASSSASDRRSERRHAVEGKVKFFFDDSTHREVTGRLLDYSTSGFRAVHAYPELLTGQVVEFQHVIAAGQARVMWNRIADDCVETGFLIIK